MIPLPYQTPLEALEARIAALDRPELFDADCRAAFSGPGGIRLMTTLSTLLVPILTTCARPSPEDTYRLIGRAEVVMALWRRSQPQNMPYPNERNEKEVG